MKQIFKDLSFGVNVIVAGAVTGVRLTADGVTAGVAVARTAAGDADSAFASAVVSTGDGKLGAALKGGDIYGVSRSSIISAYDDTFGSELPPVKPRRKSAPKK